MARAVRAARASLGAAALALAACGRVAPAPPACAAPAVQASLFLGRAVPGRQAPVSRAEWEEFAAAEVSPRFPDGFTVLEGHGQWRSPATGTVTREDTVLLLVVAPPGTETARRLEEIAAGWRRRFRQDSVGIVTAPVCTAF